MILVVYVGLEYYQRLGESKLRHIETIITLKRKESMADLGYRFPSLSLSLAYIGLVHYQRMDESKYII